MRIMPERVVLYSGGIEMSDLAASSIRSETSRVEGVDLSNEFFFLSSI